MVELRIQAFLTNIFFESGLEVPLKQDDILVIIGPNNSGKSASLREIASRASGDLNGALLRGVRIERLTPLKDIIDALAGVTAPNGSISVSGYHFGTGNVSSWWTTDPSAPIGPFFRSRVFAELGTRERLSDCDPQPNYDRRAPFSASHPFQYFHKDYSLEESASKLFRRAFKKDLVIHRGNSLNIPAYVGQRPKISKGQRVDSSAYYDRVEELDPLEIQGDGMRSFTSILGRVLVEERPIILIDEPEAFLHPPQARMLADIIAAESAGRQTLIATHSSEVLQGLLGKHAKRVSVVRLKRTAKGGSAVLLPSSDVIELWKDPILRFSNILDGLFHDVVVVTEADADCRFFEALSEVAVPERRLPDIHFTYSGGKDRLPVVVKALKGVGVPVATIADFDLLNNEQPLRKIVEAHGGDWNAIEPLWRAVKNAVEQSKAFLDAGKFKAALASILDKISPAGSVDKDILKKVKELARDASAWDYVKKSGLSALPNGEPHKSAETLLESLRELGIFVTPVGEMEGFCRPVGGHGPRWVEEVMKRNLRIDTDLVGARAFITEVVSYLHTKLR